MKAVVVYGEVGRVSLSGLFELGPRSVQVGVRDKTECFARSAFRRGRGRDRLAGRSRSRRRRRTARQGQQTTQQQNHLRNQGKKFIVEVKLNLIS